MIDIISLNCNKNLMVAFIIFFLMKTKVLLQTNTIEKKKLPDRTSANLEEYVIRKEMMKVKKERKEKNNRI